MMWTNWLKKAEKIPIQINKKISDRIDLEIFNLCEKISNNKTIIFDDLDNKSRKYAHIRCDQLGLKHESCDKNDKRILEIKIPTHWKLKDPIILPRLIFRHHNLHCSECGADGNDVELFECCFVRGMFCQDCIDADDELDGMKWE